jgi:hypothetical protein
MPGLRITPVACPASVASILGRYPCRVTGGRVIQRGRFGMRGNVCLGPSARPTWWWRWTWAEGPSVPRTSPTSSFLVGGPDGLSRECLARAGMRWSLSPLTLPHALVRIVVAEQLYRAWSILKGHPYHRE